MTGTHIHIWIPLGGNVLANTVDDPFQETMRYNIKSRLPIVSQDLPVENCFSNKSNMCERYTLPWTVLCLCDFSDSHKHKLSWVPPSPFINFLDLLKHYFSFARLSLFIYKIKNRNCERLRKIFLSYIFQEIQSEM